MARSKTGDVLKAMDLAHRRKVERDEVIHEQSKQLVRALCNADLVDDVDPDPGATPETPEIFCAVCGRLIPVPLLSCPICNEEAEEIEW